MRVLIADHSKVMRKIFRSLLAAMKVAEDDLFEAADGSEATVILAQTRPSIDFVISDWDLPGLDGPSFHRQLRAGRRRTLTLWIGKNCGGVMDISSTSKRKLTFGLSHDRLQPGRISFQLSSASLADLWGTK